MIYQWMTDYTSSENDIKLFRKSDKLCSQLPDNQPSLKMNEIRLAALETIKDGKYDMQKLTSKKDIDIYSEGVKVKLNDQYDIYV